MFIGKINNEKTRILPVDLRDPCKHTKKGTKLYFKDLKAENPFETLRRKQMIDKLFQITSEGQQTV